MIPPNDAESSDEVRSYILVHKPKNEYFILKVVFSKSHPEYRIIIDDNGNKKIDIEKILFEDKESDVKESLKDVVEDSLNLDIRKYLDTYKITKKKLILVK